MKGTFYASTNDRGATEGYVSRRRLKASIIATHSRAIKAVEPWFNGWEREGLYGIQS